jgi:integrase
MGLLRINGWYYFHKRVPKHIKPFESKNFIRFTLKTKDKLEAMKKAVAIEDELNEGWKALKEASKINNEFISKAHAIAKIKGFEYKSANDLAVASPIEELIKRLEIAFRHLDDQQISKAMLGVAKQPKMPVNKCIEKFWPLCADRFTNKSEHQIVKYKNPRNLAMKEFCNVVGNKGLAEIDRSDILKFHRFLLQKISNGLNPDSANKRMLHVKDILRIISIHFEIHFDDSVLFKDTRFKVQKKSRHPYEADFVQNTIFPNLQNLNEHARLLVMAMADTGAREGELVGLEKEDIFLDSPIPHIWIRPKEKRSLKTPHSERKIPLVGSALHAFTKLPEGFTRYKEADSISALVNKYFKNNDLRPTDRHSLYSLRHTFKDRLRDAGAPEEIIDQMMGHRTYKPKYGRGHKLETAQKWLEKIAFKIPI